MKNMFKTSIGMLVAIGLLTVPAVSQAADPLTVKVEPGVAVPLNKPQTDHFDVGGAGQVQALVGLTPWLDLGPSVSLLVLPTATSGGPTGTAWGFGGGLRLKRPHDESNTGTGWSAVSPWAGADLQYVRTGDLDRAGVELAVGASVPTSDSRQLWVGPFARMHEVVQGNRPGFDSTDSRTLILGVSFEFGGGVKKAAPAEASLSDRDHDGTPDVTDRCPDVPGPKENQGCPYPEAKPEAKPQPKPPVAAPLEVKQVIQFAWDSAALRSSEDTRLAEVTKLLLANVNYQARVEGHASSEGQAEHNDKLSLKRAQAVVDFLVKQGVARDRLTAVGLGSSVPVADNATNAGRVANRRVEFVVKFVLVNGESK